MNEKPLYVVGSMQSDKIVKGVLETLNQYKPEQLFLEVLDEHVKSDEVYTYSVDFVAAYIWAKDNDVLVNGFEFPTDYIKPILQQTLESIRNLQSRCELSDFRELNKRSYDHLFADFESQLFKTSELEKRRNGMINNIKTARQSDRTGLVLVGLGHLPYFEKNLTDATFPYR